MRINFHILLCYALPLLFGAPLLSAPTPTSPAPVSSAPALAAAPAPAVPPAVSTLTGIELQDGAGKTHTLAEFAAARVLVLVFLGVRCPMANGYAETLSEIQTRLAGRGVQLVGVNSNPDDTASSVAAHSRTYRLTFPVLKDAKQELADALGARTTPEAFVLDAQRKLLYRGRIDDGYASRARKNAITTSRDLSRAVEAVLAGRPVPVATTTALGCAIPRPRPAPTVAAKVTYHRDVAPILQARCQACHRPGQVAPFPLISYADAKSWAGEIKEFTQNRQMPPWLAEPGHGDFADVRRLSDREIATLAEWADSGAPEGSAEDAPPQRQWSNDWMMGKPDLVLSASEAYQVAATGKDEFRVFVLPTGLMEDRQIVGFDFRPGSPQAVHHLVMLLDVEGRGRELDAADRGPGYSSGPGGVGIPSAVLQSVWAPGNLPRLLPQGVVRQLPKGADLLLQIHYHKTGKVEMDRTQVGLYFSRKPAAHIAQTTIIGSRVIDIPARAARHQVRMTTALPTDVRLLNIMPHMHLLGKDMKVTATLPDGTQQNLVWIKEWDYRWQDSYRFKEPLFLPAGTKLELVAHFDNSAGNPRNPNSPPRRVRFGEHTTDEMASAIIEYVATSPLPLALEEEPQR